jgi:hypothetical protein
MNAYEILKNRLGEKEAVTLIQFFEMKTEKSYLDRKDVFSTKIDLSELESRLSQRIYTANIVQFLATVASILGILKMMFQ